MLKRGTAVFPHLVTCTPLQVAMLTGRTAVIPDLPCHTSWLHRGPPTCDGTPISTEYTQSESHTSYDMMAVNDRAALHAASICKHERGMRPSPNDVCHVLRNHQAPGEARHAGLVAELRLGSVHVQSALDTVDGGIDESVPSTIAMVAQAGCHGMPSTRSSSLPSLLPCADPYAYPPDFSVPNTLLDIKGQAYDYEA
jgi:hypothetical protein